MLIAVDTNVLMDLAAGVESIVDALEVVRRRLKQARLLVVPTVVQELKFIAKFGETDGEVHLAETALGNLIHWGFEVAGFVPANFARLEEISQRLIGSGVFPETEINDSIILIEASFLGCDLLLTSDAHFTDLDFELLTLQMKPYNVSPPVIATPRNLVRRFYR